MRHNGVKSDKDVKRRPNLECSPCQKSPRPYLVISLVFFEQKTADQEATEGEEQVHTYTTYGFQRLAGPIDNDEARRREGKVSTKDKENRNSAKQVEFDAPYRDPGNG